MIVYKGKLKIEFTLGSVGIDGNINFLFRTGFFALCLMFASHRNVRVSGCSNSQHTKGPKVRLYVGFTEEFLR